MWREGIAQSLYYVWAKGALLENYYPSGDLEAQIERFIDHYGNQRYHESLDILTSAGVYFGRGHAILLERARIKRKTIEQRRLFHRKRAA